MSVYNKYHVDRKEALQRIRNPGNRNDGLCPDRVLFSNEENVYHGTFVGNIACVLSNLLATDGSLSNVQLVGGKIALSSGDIVELSDLASRTDEAESAIQSLSSGLNELSSQTNELSSMFISSEISTWNAVSSLSSYANQLCAAVGTKQDKLSQAQMSAIESVISDDYVRLVGGESQEDGDLWQVGGKFYIWQGDRAWPIGDGTELIDLLSAKVNALSGNINAVSSIVSALATSASYAVDSISSLSNDVSSLSDAVSAVSSYADSISTALSDDYYTKDQTDDAIDRIAAYYITKDQAGNPFDTVDELTSAQEYWSGGEIRDPTRNDYAIVLSVDNHHAAWRYIFTMPAGSSTGVWQPQYAIETNDYDALDNKPQINGVELAGDVSLDQLSAVPESRTVNSKMLSSDITLHADDITMQDGSSQTVAESISEISAVLDDKAELYIDNSRSKSLSIAWISQDDFYQKVMTSSLLSNEMYFVSSDYVNAYGMQVKNAAPGIDESDAVTMQQLSRKRSLEDLEYTVSVDEPSLEDKWIVQNAPAIGVLEPYIDPSWNTETDDYYGWQWTSKDGLLDKSMTLSLDNGNSKWHLEFRQELATLFSGDVLGDFNDLSLDFGSGYVVKRYSVVDQIALTSYVDNSLSVKQDKLSDAQMSAIDSVVDERATVVKFSDGSVESYDIVDQLTQSMRTSWETEHSAAIQDVKIGSAVTDIANQTFSRCYELTNVTIPDSVTQIGQDVFAICSSLTSLTIPDSVTKLGFTAFSDCSNLTSLVFKGKTIEQVQAMANYPWGIDADHISTWNSASQEWVSAQNYLTSFEVPSSYKTYSSVVSSLSNDGYLTSADIIAPSTELSAEGKAAGAKAVGDALADKLNSTAAYDKWMLSEAPYSKGEVVSKDGELYKSNADNNVSEPGTAGASWTRTSIDNLKQDTLTSAQLANIADVPTKANTADVNTALASKASLSDLSYRIAEAGFKWQFAAAAFPITYTVTETSTAVTIAESDADDIIWTAGDDAYLAYDGVTFCYFDTDGETITASPDVSNLQFNGVSPPDAHGLLVKTVLDRTVNLVTATDETSIDIELPETVQGYSRDFYLRITVLSGESAPALNLPSGYVFRTPNDQPIVLASSETEDAVTVLRFTETVEDEFAVSYVPASNASSNDEYLPLSGGHLSGAVSFPQNVELSIGQALLQDTDGSYGFTITKDDKTFKFGGADRFADDVMTYKDISSKADISALGVLSGYMHLSGAAVEGSFELSSSEGISVYAPDVYVNNEPIATNADLSVKRDYIDLTYQLALAADSWTLHAGSQTFTLDKVNDTLWTSEGNTWTIRLNLNDTWRLAYNIYTYVVDEFEAPSDALSIDFGKFDEYGGEIYATRYKMTNLALESNMAVDAKQETATIALNPSLSVDVVTKLPSCYRVSDASFSQVSASLLPDVAVMISNQDVTDMTTFGFNSLSGKWTLSYGGTVIATWDPDGTNGTDAQSYPTPTYFFNSNDLGTAIPDIAVTRCLADRTVNYVNVHQVKASTYTIPAVCPIALQAQQDGMMRNAVADISLEDSTSAYFLASDISGNALEFIKDSSLDLSSLSGPGHYVLAFKELSIGTFSYSGVEIPATSSQVNADWAETDPASPAYIENKICVELSVSDVAQSVASKLDSAAAAPVFSETSTYMTYDYVTYDGQLWRFLSSHISGAWSQAEVENVDMTTPDATLDITSEGKLRVVQSDGEVLWMQGYSLAGSSSLALSDMAVNRYDCLANQTGEIWLSLPVPVAGKVGDFILDVTNPPVLSDYTGIAAYDSSTTYAVSDSVTYDGKVWSCLSASTTGTWDETKWRAYAFAVLPYLSTESYSTSAVVLYDGSLWSCNTDSTTGAWDQTKWDDAAPSFALADLDNKFSVVVEKGVDLSSIVTVEPDTLARIYFTCTAFNVNSLPTWQVSRLDVENGGAS